MPTYEFRCPNGHTFDQLHKISDAPQTATCPTCGAEAVRAISGGAGLVFKGSGFYLTDYGKNAHRTSGPANAGGEGKSESKGDGAGSGSKDAAGGKESSGGSSGGDKGSKDAGSSSSGAAAVKPSGGKSSDGSSSGGSSSGGASSGGAAA